MKTILIILLLLGSLSATAQNVYFAKTEKTIHGKSRKIVPRYGTTLNCAGMYLNGYHKRPMRTQYLFEFKRKRKKK